ncbi:plasmid replication protein RepCa2 [Stappia aggregata IAM 12614]|uniref:Plasmid replication protein RepCa2 n=1 Tax=Roseibium aggregatum (strain ATCC 25650 / DSM 13394 / JCM 20685 / NBRC 16684 / NCIMB 2208 / IAM 12614 / B1) TaxID=384765 RepID=A0P071_ROSAI|nr:plasmid replication protein RepCa2 [Stappia aggregata IAM 12614] [Roseibium aggregatum IAM 12614]
MKRAAQPIGLTSTAYHVLDILLGLSKPDDWKGDNRPVVAISNEKLASYVGKSERTVIRAIKQLVEARILAYRDSSTGRRWVHRNDSGDITFAYGLDFTPARVRYREIKRQADEWQAHLNAVREAKRTVARLSRAIVDIVEATKDADLTDFLDQMQAILESQQDVQIKAQALLDLYDLVMETLKEASDTREKGSKNNNTSCEDDIDVTPLFNTSSPDSCLNNRTSANADEIKPNPDVAYGAEMAPEKEQAQRGRGSNQRYSGQKGTGKADFVRSETLDAVSISLLESACTSIQSDFGVALKSWPDLISATDVLRIGIGLSEKGFTDACGKLGRHVAAAILAMVAEKALRDPEKISSPGGYFRACCERAAEGRLALAKSLFGLAAR